MINLKNIMSLFASLTMAIAMPAADFGSGAPAPATRMDINAENVYIRSSLTILNNELMNNGEEEYIVLGTDRSYFNGFNEGMTDVISQLGSFDYTGNLSADIAVLEASFQAEEARADALGTGYGTGQGTAYQYAIIVLNRRSLLGAGTITSSSIRPVTPVPATPEADNRPLASPSRTIGSRKAVR